MPRKCPVCGTALPYITGIELRGDRLIIKRYCVSCTTTTEDDEQLKLPEK